MKYPRKSKYYKFSKRKELRKQKKEKKSDRENNTFWRAENLKRNIEYNNLKAEVFQHYSNGKTKCTKCNENALGCLFLNLVTREESEHSHDKGLKWGEFCCVTDLFEQKKKRRPSASGEVFYNNLKKTGFPEGIEIICYNCKHLERVYKPRKKNIKPTLVHRREYVLKLKIETLSKYSDKKIRCVCCGVGDIRVLELDHILPKSHFPYNSVASNHTRHRANQLVRNEKKDKKNFITGIDLYLHLKKNNFPTGNYQVLCRNCNRSKAAKSDCCHKLSRVQLE